MPKKSKEDELDEKLTPFVGAVGSYVFKAPRGDFPAIAHRESDEAVRFALMLMWECSRAFLELRGCYSDLVLTGRMATRYPWRSRTVTRAKHMEFVWFQFLNLCYHFREKYKLSANKHNRLMRLFARSSSEDIGKTLRMIDAEIGEFIRARGRHVHEWGVYHGHVTMLSSFELLNRANQPDVTKEQLDLQYRIARSTLNGDIQRAANFMHSFLLKSVDGYLGEFVSVVTQLNEAIEKAKLGLLSLELK